MRHLGMLLLATVLMSSSAWAAKLTAGSILFASGNVTTVAISEDSTKLFWDNANNRLGIGTNTPSQALDVVGTINATTWSGDGSGITNTPGWSGSTNIYLPAKKLGIGTSSPSGYLHVVENSKDAIYVDATGNVGIHTNAPTVALQVGTNGDGTTAGASAWNNFSDRRLKRDIQPLPTGTLRSLKGVTYKWKKNGQPSLGFIAQDVERYYPELVHTDSEGYKSVDYFKSVAILIERIKQVDKETEASIARLEAEIQSLNADINDELAIIKEMEKSQDGGTHVASH